MKTTFLSATSALALSAGVATAGGLDRSYTSIGILFEAGNYAELSYGFTTPEVDGVDTLGNPIANVAADVGMVGGGFKVDMNEKLSLALIFDQPYGADVQYGGNPAGTMLGGTLADAESNALTMLAKYRISDRFSLYGGPRVVRAKGDITLSGGAYGPLSSYQVNLASDQGYGFVAGAAYEIPDIALRASLTYHSAVDLSFRSTETIPVAAGGTGLPVVTGNTKSELPQSVKLEVQSGIAANTLLFGSVRWSEWEAFRIDPPSPQAPNLASLDDQLTYELGIGRQFTSKLSGRLSISYEPGGPDDLVSPLSPTDGRTSVTVGGKYKLSESVDISGGVVHTWLGNARAQTANTPRATFTDNTATTFGLKIGVHF